MTSSFTDKPIGYPVSPLKFWILSLFALNLFPFYWGYKTFLAFDPTDAKRPRVLAVMNGLFLFARIHKLMVFIEKSSAQMGAPVKFPKLFYSIATFFLFWTTVTLALSHLPYLLIIPHMCEMLILFQIQKAVLKINRQLRPGNFVDTRITAKNAAAIVCSLVIAVLGPENFFKHINDSIPESSSSSEYKRWIYATGPNTHESYKKGYTTDKIESFWKRFKDDSNKLDPSKNLTEATKYAPRFMLNQLMWIDERLLWEIGMDHFNPKKCSFTVTTNDESTRPIINTFFAKAPKLDNWNYYSYYQPYPPNVIQSEMLRRFKSKVTAFSTSCRVNDINMIEVIITSPDFKTEEDKESQELATNILKLTLGQETFDKWVGSIFLEKKDVKTPVNAGAAELVKQVTEAKAAIANSLPAKHYWQIDKGRFDKFALLRKEEIEKTPLAKGVINFYKATSYKPFYSQRYSKTGETFCFLVFYDIKDDPKLDLQPILDDFNDSLEENKCGCALGSDYVAGDFWSIQLILSDVQKALPALQAVATKHKLSKNSWIFFHDAILQDEYIGLYKDSPVPYMNESSKSEEERKGDD